MKQELILKKEWGSRFNLIGIWPMKINERYIVFCLKNQINMHTDKAIGALHWLRRTMADKQFPCFLYDPCIETIYGDGIGYNYKDIFADDDDIYSEELNNKKIEELVERFGGWLPTDSWKDIGGYTENKSTIKIIDDPKLFMNLK